VTEAAFGQRRKMLRQSLKTLSNDPQALLAAAGIAPTERAEDIPVAGFVALARALTDATTSLSVRPRASGDPEH
jgi:16S rRNA (adenine1518-N6/adenine1519-N6)-dimethyltransferase